MFFARVLTKTLSRRFAQADYVVIPSHEGHFVDPEDVSKRIINIIRAHDRIKDPKIVTFDRPFADMGLDDLDLVEIFLEVEKDFFMEFSDDQVESFRTVHDAVEVVSNHRFADTY
jgi:acyl carrier protein